MQCMAVCCLVSRLSSDDLLTAVRQYVLMAQVWSVRLETSLGVVMCVCNTVCAMLRLTKQKPATQRPYASVHTETGFSQTCYITKPLQALTMVIMSWSWLFLTSVCSSHIVKARPGWIEMYFFAIHNFSLKILNLSSLPTPPPTLRDFWFTSEFSCLKYRWVEARRMQAVRAREQLFVCLVQWCLNTQDDIIKPHRDLKAICLHSRSHVELNWDRSTCNSS